MRALIAVASLLLVGAMVACGDDDVTGEPGSSSGSNTDGGTSGASGNGSTSSSSGETGPNNEFVVFVKDQIVNQTKNDTAPATLNDKTFTDSERSDLFDTAFFSGSYEQ